MLRGAGQICRTGKPASSFLCLNGSTRAKPESDRATSPVIISWTALGSDRGARNTQAVQGQRVSDSRGAATAAGKRSLSLHVKSTKSVAQCLSAVANAREEKPARHGSDRQTIARTDGRADSVCVRRKALSRTSTVARVPTENLWKRRSGRRPSEHAAKPATGTQSTTSNFCVR